jgi:hypothetical protein
MLYQGFKSPMSRQCGHGLMVMISACQAFDEGSTPSAHTKYNMAHWTNRNKSPPFQGGECEFESRMRYLKTHTAITYNYLSIIWNIKGLGSNPSFGVMTDVV